MTISRFSETAVRGSNRFEAPYLLGSAVCASPTVSAVETEHRAINWLRNTKTNTSQCDCCGNRTEHQPLWKRNIWSKRRSERPRGTKKTIKSTFQSLVETEWKSSETRELHVVRDALLYDFIRTKQPWTIIYQDVDLPFGRGCYLDRWVLALSLPRS